MGQALRGGHLDLGCCVQVGLGVSSDGFCPRVVMQCSGSRWGHRGEPLSPHIWGLRGMRNTPKRVTTQAVSLTGSQEVVGAFCEGVVRLGHVFSKE